jgi:hypothetical protein
LAVERGFVDRRFHDKGGRPLTIDMEPIVDALFMRRRSPRKSLLLFAFSNKFNFGARDKDLFLSHQAPSARHQEVSQRGRGGSDFPHQADGLK